MTETLQIVLLSAVTRQRKKRVFKAKQTAMLAGLYQGETPKSYACEPKIDGMRVIVTANLDRHLVSFSSRNGNEIPSLAHLTGQVLCLLAGRAGIYILDGEATSGVSFFDGVGRLRSGHEATDALLHIFDVPSCTGTYDARRADLVAMFSQANVPDILLVDSITDMTPEEAFGKYRAEGREGVMVKDRQSLYQRGTRSSAWLKMKDADTADCEVLDVVEGQGRCAWMAGHIVVRFAGRTVSVGTGLDDNTRRQLWADRKAVIGQTAEVDFNMLTAKGSMRHPVLVRIRGDK